ncbi:MAG: cadherin-like domain-containing protein [Leptolyngbyaceae cyanobacterium]
MANKAKPIVFVDAGVEAPLQLAAGIAFDADLRILAPHADGVVQIRDAVQAHPEATEIYIIAHGAPGQLSLGSARLNLTTLSNYAADLRLWTANTRVADIYLYGCSVAAGDAGSEFLSRLRSLTQANIAASTHILGYAERGGDWHLDTVVGDLCSRELLTATAIATYPGVLNDDVADATDIAPDTPITDGNNTADAEVGEPLHDPSLAGANLAFQNSVNNSIWFTWTAGADGLVNVNTAGSAIGTVLAVYSGPDNATASDFGSFVSVATDFSATNSETTSVTFNAVNNTTYYFAVDGIGSRTTADDLSGITIELNTPPVITPAQVFTVAENSAATTAIGTVVVASGSADTWAIVSGNPDNDGDGNAAFAINAATGALTVNDADDLDFEGFPSAYQLNVSATNDAGFTDTESVFVEVTDINEAPTILNINAPGTATEGSTITLTGSVADPDVGDTQTVTIDWGDGTADSTAVVDSNGAFTAVHTYTDDFSGQISATVKDSSNVTGTTDPVTRAISVTNVDPTISPSISLTPTVAEDGSLSFFLTATDPSPTEVFTWTVGLPSAGGSVTPPAGNAATQFFTYTPDVDFNGTETFEIQVNDGDGGSDTVAFSVNVTPEADAPTALNLTASANQIDEGDAITLNGSFIDPDVGDTFTVTINWNDGTEDTVLTTDDLTFNAVNNTYSFNSGHQFLTNDDVSVVVTVQDSFGKTAIASESIIIENVPPELSPGSTFIEIDEDDSGTIVFTATDTTATEFNWSILEQGNDGTASVSITDTNATQSVTYTPDENFFGSYSFVVQVSDGDGGTKAANVTVFVNAFNDDPTNLSVNVTPTGTLNEGGSITLSGKFDDVDNSTTAFLDDTHSITVDWGDGTVETFLDTDGSIFTDTDKTTVLFDNLTHTYADEGDGSFTVTVTVKDQADAEVSTTREIQVVNVDPTLTAPAASPATFTTLEDTSFDFTVEADDVGILDVLTWSVIAGPTNGAITFGTSPQNGVQNLTYTPNFNYDGGDSFTLQVTDGDGGFNDLVYNVTVTPDNDAPTIIVNNFNIVEDQSLPVTLSVLDAQDLDGPTPLTFTITGAAAASFIVAGGDTDPSDGISFTRQDVIDGDVSFFYENTTNTPPTFTIKAEDANGAFTTQVADIKTFAPVNDAPVFVDQDGNAANGIQLGTFTVTEGASQLIDNTIIKATDEETSNRDLSFTVSNIEGGQFLLNGSSTTTFTQGNIDDGLVRFENDGTETDPSYTLTVTDGGGKTATISGTGTVNTVNNAPDITVNNFTIVEGEELAVDTSVLNAVDEDDLDPSALTFTVTGTANRGVDSFIVDGVAGATSFTLAQIFANQVSFLYENVDDVAPAFTIKVADDETPTAGQDSEAANIENFTAVNDAPLLDGDPASATIEALLGITVDEGGVVQVKSTAANPNIGAVDEESGPAALTFTVSDIEGGDFLVAGTVSTTFTQAQLSSGAVFFKHDGTETVPSYTVTVTDGGGKSSAPQSVVGTIGNAVNDAPTIIVNDFDVTEGVEFDVTTAVLDAIDIDSVTEIKFTITGDDADSFLVNGTAIASGDSFTRSQIVDGEVSFLYEGETTPIFSITASDQEMAPANPAPATVTVAGDVTFTEVNDTPVFLDGGVPDTDGILPSFTVTENGNVTITNQVIRATDGDFDDRDLVFTVSNVEGGDFFLVGSADPVTEFTQNDVNLGRVFFRNDGSQTDPSYDISVTDGEETATAAGVGTVSAVNDAPVITINNFNVTEGTPLVVDPSVLNATDEETVNISGITFTVSGADKDSFLINGTALTADQFTLADVFAGTVTFDYDEETTPIFTITATDDGTLTTGPGDVATKSVAVAGDVTFTSVNDAPEFVDQDGNPANGNQLGDITVNENSFTSVGTSIISATDADNDDDDLTFTVSDVTGGVFAVNSPTNTTTTFTQADLAAGKVFFVNSGENDGTTNTIGYTITVSDGDKSSTLTGGGTVNPQDDPPVLETNQFDVTEGVEFTVTTDILDATDVDTPDANIVFTISGADFASFSLSGTPLTDGGSFTRGNILAGDVTFKYEGEDAPEFTITLQDLTTTLPAVNGNVEFAPVNDAPTFRIDDDANAANATSIPLTEGGTLNITPALFQVTDAEVAANVQDIEDLQFTVDAVSGGVFQRIGVETTTFTQADIDNNFITFVHDGTETVPSFTITLNDNGSPTPESVTQTVTQADFNFTFVNDVPELQNNKLTITEGQTVTLTTNNLSAIDVETNALDLSFTVTDVTNGQFSVDGGSTFITGDVTGANAFTLLDIIQSNVLFKHDDTGETPTDNKAPSFSVQVADTGADAGPGGLGNQSSPITPTEITFIEVNDAPELTPDGDTPLNTANDPFAIIEGGILVLNNPADTFPGIQITDPDTAPEDVTVTVSNVAGGFFASTSDTETAITTFTQAQLDSNLIVFNHDGSETAPGFTVSVTDGNKSDLQNYVATLTTVNDAPEITLNTLTLTEGDKVTLTTSNLAGSDAETGPANLTYSISNLTNGAFFNGTTEIAPGGTGTFSFTQQEVIDGNISFEHDGSNDAPTYTLTLTDDGTGSQSMSQASSMASDAVISFTPVNDAPEPFLIASTPTEVRSDGLFTISQGGTTIINQADANQLRFEDEETTDPALLTYTVDEVNKGTFLLDGVATTEFTQQDLNLLRVAFQHDGSEFAPSYTVTVSDSGVPSPVESVTLTVDLAANFINANDTPVLGNNALTIDEGQTILFDTSNLSATDSETANLDLEFTISAIKNGKFVIADDPSTVADESNTFGETTFTSDSTAQTGGTFTLRDVVEGRVSFIHDGFDAAPEYTVKVTDDDITDQKSSAEEAAIIAFTRENDDPTLISSTGPITIGTGGDQVTLSQFDFTINEGATKSITLSQINAADEPGETAQIDLTFEVSDVEGGFFALASAATTPITEFTWVQVNNGDLVFKHDGKNTPPTYTLTVTDDEGGTTSADFVGTLTAVNDAPVVTPNAIVLTEDGTVTIDATILTAEDEESLPANLTYAVDSVVGGEFQLSGTKLDPGTGTFTQADVIAGNVTFVDDGLDDTAPTFQITLTDEAISPGTGDLAAKSVVLTDTDFAVAANFTAENDIPTPAEFIVLPFATVVEGETIQIVSGTPDPMATVLEPKIFVEDEESGATELVYTVDSIDNAAFKVNGATQTTFTQDDIDNGLVAFVHDGSENAPSFTLSVSDNDGGTGANTLSQTLDDEITFQLANEAPTITANTLSPIEGEEITLTTANLAATDREDLATELIFEITDVVGGTFFLNGAALDVTAAGNGLGEFSILQVAAGALTFEDDGNETPPSYKVTVTDADPTNALSTGPVAAVIDLTNFPVNDAPTIVTSSFPITEGQALELKTANLLTTDDDNSAAELTYTASNETAGEFFLFNTTTLQLEATSTFTQQDVADNLVVFKHDGTEVEPSFTLTVSDGGDGTDAVIASIANGNVTFSEVNDTPIAADDSFVTDQDTALTNLAVTANDSDDGGVLVVTEIDGQTSPVTLASGAVVSISGNAIGYDPNGAFDSLALGSSVTETFTYTVNDSDPDLATGKTATAAVSITVNGQNDAPTAVADTATTFENTAITINVLTNDDDVDTGDTLTITSVGTVGTTGTVTNLGTSILYDPSGKFTLGDSAQNVDSFTYTISDSQGVTATATVTVTVDGVNDSPIAVDDSGPGFETNDNQALNGLNLTANDEDPDNDTFSIVKINDATVNPGNTVMVGGSTITLVNGDTIDFDPSPTFRTLAVGESTTQSFNYTIEDTGGKQDTAEVTITLNGVNENPVVGNTSLSFATNEGVPLTLDVLTDGNVTDIDVSDTLFISGVDTSTITGQVTNNGSTLTYTPAATLTGGQTITENFTYTVGDGNSGTATGSVSIVVTGVNDPPVAVNDSGVSFATNEATTFTTGSVLANDFDPEGGSISLAGVNTGGTRGLVTNNGNGTFSYDPNGAFNVLPVNRTTTDTFSYTIQDSDGLTDTATVSVTVTGLLSGFLDYEQFLRLQNPAAVAPTDTVDVLPLAQLYDEFYYLNQNPDVAALVGSVFSSGYDHFVQFGQFEGRNPSVLYNEAFYLQDPEFRAAVLGGGFSSGLQHYLNFGHRENRDPSQLFDASDYLLNNPDVANVIASGGLASGFQHYILAGVDEQRLPSLSLFDNSFYLANNPDLVTAGVTDGFGHFVTSGQFENRQPSALYNEASYLGLNPGLVGLVPSGFQHFVASGRFEGRFVFPV